MDIRTRAQRELTDMWAHAILKSSSTFQASRQRRKQRPEGVIEGRLGLILEE